MDHLWTIPDGPRSFDSAQAFPSIVMSWIRLSRLPRFFYKRKNLMEIRAMIGKVAKLDMNTNNKIRGRFARMAVYVNLDELLVSQVLINGKIQKIEYEFLPTVCFQCRRYGHVQDYCSSKNIVPISENSFPVSKKSDMTVNGKDENMGNFGPWMSVENRYRRKFRDSSKSKAYLLINDKKGDMEGAVSYISNPSIYGDHSSRHKRKGILIEEDLDSTIGKNKERRHLNLGGIYDAKVGSGNEANIKPNSGTQNILHSGLWVDNIKGSNDLGLVNKANLGLKEIAKSGFKDTACLGLKKSTGTGLEDTGSSGFKETSVVGDREVDIRVKGFSKIWAATLSRIEFLNSLIQEEYEEVEEETMDFAHLRNEKKLETAMVSTDMRKEGSDLMVAEVIDVTVSKSVSGLGPCKCSTVTFKMLHDDKIGGKNSRISVGTSRRNKINLGKKNLGSRLKIASTSKSSSKSVQTKGNNLKKRHSNLVPLRESMKKLAESLSFQDSNTSGPADPLLGKDQQVTQGNTFL